MPYHITTSIYPTSYPSQKWEKEEPKMLGFSITKEELNKIISAQEEIVQKFHQNNGNTFSPTRGELQIELPECIIGEYLPREIPLDHIIIAEVDPDDFIAESMEEANGKENQQEEEIEERGWNLNEDGTYCLKANGEIRVLIQTKNGVWFHTQPLERGFNALLEINSRLEKNIYVRL